MSGFIGFVPRRCSCSSSSRCGSTLEVVKQYLTPRFVLLSGIFVYGINAQDLRLIRVTVARSAMVGLLLGYRIV